MFSISIISFVLLAYIALLFVVAQRTEHRRKKDEKLGLGPIIYTLSLTTYTTAWTYYGSVGSAARSGFIFLCYYLGPTLTFFFAGSMLKQIIRLKEAHRFTSLADFISTRYSKSQALAVASTVLSIVISVPYIALQLKTMVVSTAIITGYSAQSAYSGFGEFIAPAIALLMLAFTILFGLRRLTPTERHPGVIAALSVAGLLKLVAFLCLGVFVTYFLFDGVEDIFRRLNETHQATQAIPRSSGEHHLANWFTYLLLSFSAVIFLPRQFLTTVIENSSERHLRTAAWLFPLYLLLTTIFIIPIAAGGLLLGFDRTQADNFVLTIPVTFGNHWLSLAVFLGGVAAGTAMIVISNMAVSTMISNHILVPLFSRIRLLNPLRRRVLWMRWFAAAGLMGAAFIFERVFGPEFNLEKIGLIAFAGVLQFAPGIVAGLYWSKANRAGALAGLISGGLVWFYTLLIPEVGITGFLPETLRTEGPFGITVLRPEALFGLSIFPPLTHSVFWSLVINISGLLLGSIFIKQTDLETAMADEYLAILESPKRRSNYTAQPDTIDLSEKRKLILKLYGLFFQPIEAQNALAQTLAQAGLLNETTINILQLAELKHKTEQTLASAIGAPAAYAAMREHNIVDSEESRQLSAAYADLLTELKIPPSELKERVDFHQQRALMLEREARTARILAKASQQMFSTLDAKATLRAIVNSPIPELADAAIIYLPRGYSLIEEMQPVAAIGHVDRLRSGAEFSSASWRRVVNTLEADPKLCNRLGSIYTVLRTQKSHAVPKDTPERWAPLLTNFPLQSSYTIPLLARGSLFGVFVLLSSSAEQYGKSDSQIIEQLGQQAANALDNALLYSSAQNAIQAREDFLAIASHELRTPLTGLRTQVQLLARLAATDQLTTYPIDRLKALLLGSDRHIERLARLISELLSLSRARADTLQLQPEDVDLSSLITETLERLRPEFNVQKCEIIADLPKGVSGCWDRMRIEQVIVNLLMNALKYAPGKPIEIRTWKEPDRCHFSVRDHGVGISKQDQNRIFMRFERIHRNLGVSGFGLGLYIVKQIVQAHGGAVRVESELGAGSIFTVDLPKAVPQCSEVSG